MEEENVGSLRVLVAAFAKLPGIGEKSAERLAFHLLKASKEEAMELAYAIRDVKEKMRHCRICFNLTDHDECGICTDPKRDRSILCVVERPVDVWALEKTGTYRGVYHVLLGRVAPLDDVGPGDLTLSNLAARVERGDFTEVILATTPTLEGDGTALYIQRMLQDRSIEMTRIARGIPSGSTLEYANRLVLADALEGRRSF